jgi:hypothetical protein
MANGERQPLTLTQCASQFYAVVNSPVTFAFFASFGGYSSLTHTLTRLLIGREKAQKAQKKTRSASAVER